MLKNNFEVQVIVNGSPVKEYSKDGKVFIEGKENSKYSIKITNKSHRRILAVPTVDGLSVIDGKLASYNSQGYIIDGYASEIIYGWRKDGDTVADFYFSDLKNSYASKSDKGGYQGVIGMAIFYEVDRGIWSTISSTVIPPVKYYDPWSNTSITTWGKNETFVYNSSSNLSSSGSYSLSTSGPAVNSSGSNIESNKDANMVLATGWGDDRKSSVSKVSFDREDDPISIFEIYYNSRKELEKIGIDFGKKPIYINEPTAFPGEYCQPPKK